MIDFLIQNSSNQGQAYRQNKISVSNLTNRVEKIIL